MNIKAADKHGVNVLKCIDLYKICFNIKLKQDFTKQRGLKYKGLSLLLSAAVVNKGFAGLW